MRDVARIFAPFLPWLALFGGVYGLHGIGCGLGWPGVEAWGTALHRAALVGAFGLSLVLQGLLLPALAGPLGAAPGFARGVSLTLAAAAVPSLAWSLFPVLFASSCRRAAGSASRGRPDGGGEPIRPAGRCAPETRQRGETNDGT